MHFSLLILLCVAFSSIASVEKEISGNLEVQGRHSWNNEKAQDDLFQNWNQEDFYLIYGNLNGKLEKDGNRLEANWFVRHSYSQLYRNNYVATRIFTFPNRLVARDIFKLQYENQENNYYTESVLNKFYFEKSFESQRLTLGRMYINYGQGEIFNPLNPFNQPMALTSISQVAQGNDGIGIKWFLNDRHLLEFYLLGNKRIEGYDGDIDVTAWIHGEYQFSESLQLDYVGGEDQNRRKIGGQISYNFQDALVFSQVLYQSKLINNDPSHQLWDILIGYDEQLTSKWHLRFEGGYQKRNRFNTLDSFGERFLPTEYFLALANQYEVHPLIKLNGTIINDIKSGFTYVIGKSTFDLGHNMEADIFAFIPLATGDDTDNPAQKLVTTDVGAALRLFF